MLNETLNACLAALKGAENDDAALVLSAAPPFRFTLKNPPEESHHQAAAEIARREGEADGK